jgi:ribosomal protein S16
MTRAWVPMPLMPDTDYQKSLGQSWTGNAATMRVYRDEKYGAGIFYAEWPAGETAPVAEVVTRFATRDRAVDLSAPGNPAPEDKATLQKYLSATKFITTDGIVRKQAREITKNSGTDVEKAKAWLAKGATPSETCQSILKQSGCFGIEKERILAARPYAVRVRALLDRVSQRMNRAAHPLFAKRPGNKVVVAVVTSDRGLCGGFNANVLRKAVAIIEGRSFVCTSEPPCCRPVIGQSRLASPGVLEDRRAPRLVQPSTRSNAPSAPKKRS